MTNVPLANIIVGDNVRHDLGDIDELTNSVQLHGVLVPITITDDYRLVAGFRRLTAATNAGLPEIPVHFVGQPLNVTVLQVVENVQRKDLMPSEVAQAYRALEGMNMTQREIATQVGVQQSQVSRKLALLRLSPKVLKMVDSDDLTEKVAVEIAKINDHHIQEMLAQDPTDFRIQQALDFQERTQGMDKLTKALARADIETVNEPPSGYELIGQFATVDEYRDWQEHVADEVVTIGANFEGEPVIKVYAPKEKTAGTGDIVTKARRLAQAEHLAQQRKAVAKATAKDVLVMAGDQLFQRTVASGMQAKQVARFLELDPSTHTTMTIRSGADGEPIETPVTDWTQLVRDFYESGGRSATQSVAAVLMVTAYSPVFLEWLVSQGVQDLDTLTERFLTELRESTTE